MKQWRPPIWASEKVKKKKEHLHDERQWALGIEPVEPPPTVIVQALQERITSDLLELPLGDLNSTPGVVTLQTSLLASMSSQHHHLPPLQRTQPPNIEDRSSST